MEEYMRVALVSCGYAVLTTTSFLGMGQVATKEVFDWAFSDPDIVRASSMITRLTDDVVSHDRELEQKSGHMVSGIECYMRQYGVSKQEVIDEFYKQVEDAWKDINKEFLRPTTVATPLLVRVLNLARVMDVVYKDEDGYTNVGEEMRNSIQSLLIDPVPE